SADDFSLSFATYNASFGTSYFQGLAQTYLTSLTPQALAALSPDYLTSIQNFAQNGGDISDFFGDGQFSDLLPNGTSSGSMDIDVIAVLEPFTITVGGVDLTEGGVGGISFSGTEDLAVPLGLDVK